MSSRTIELTESLYNYLLETGIKESSIARELRVKTQESTPWHRMQISPEQGAFMALVVAEALPEDGRITACDVSEEWTSIARAFWERAELQGKIDLHLRPATETLDELIDQGGADSFDFAFIDADKANYDEYYERCLVLLRPGGLVGIDNVLWGGRVADDTDDDDTRAIRALNEKVRSDKRVWATILPIGDGLTLAIKQ